MLRRDMATKKKAKSEEVEAESLEAPETGLDEELELDDDDLEGLDDEDVLAADDEDADVVVDVDDEEEEDEVEVLTPSPAAVVEKSGEGDEEEEEEEPDDEDVEASLDVILKERLVVEDEPEDEEAADQEDKTEGNERVLPKQPDEFVCRSCFLVKHPSQLADKKSMLCRDCV
jgi:Domain of unknown function (DUF4193)